MSAIERTEDVRMEALLTVKAEATLNREMSCIITFILMSVSK
jgi:hypothetical protein